MDTSFSSPLLWAAVFAFTVGGTFLFSMLTFSVSIQNRPRRLALGLWLSGGISHDAWSEWYVGRFDHYFGITGVNLPSLARSLVRSCLLSLFWVSIFFIVFGYGFGLLENRASESLSLLEVLIFATVLNFLPDYLSLLQTRLLMSFLPVIRRRITHFAVLLADFILTASISFGAISAFRFSRGLEFMGPVELLGFYSTYSFFFYSTFVTSIALLLYVCSAILVSIALRFRKWSSAEEKPGLFIGVVGGGLGTLTVFIFLLPAVLVSSEGRLSLDDFLCEQFPGQVCHHVARITVTETTRTGYLQRSCIGGRVDDCIEPAEALREVSPETAIELLEIACSEAQPIGCRRFAWMTFYGEGSETDQIEGVRLWQQSCNLGDQLACGWFGWAVLHGKGIDQDIQEGLSLLAQACNADEAFPCGWLGAEFESGVALDQDFESAAEFFLAACNLDNYWACWQLANLHRQEQLVTSELDLALGYLDRACEGDQAEGCELLGVLFALGEGTDVDQVRATDLFRKACSLELANGCTNLGLQLQYGRGTEANLDYAMIEYQKACELENAWGCQLIGFIHHEGLLGRVDLAQAAVFYELGCELGRAQSCNNAGAVYEDSQFSQSDQQLSASFLSKGCDLGYGPSCTSAGLKYEFGADGVSVDFDEAYRLYSLGCELEHGHSCVNLGLAIQYQRGSQTLDADPTSFYEQGCELDVGRGCYRAARVLGSGTVEGEELLASGCVLEFWLACFELGIVMAGAPDDQSRIRAVELIQLSCENDISAACMFLASRAGEQDTPNYQEQITYLEMACDLEQAEACWTLGYNYETGLGRPEDRERAYSYFEKACGVSPRLYCARLGEKYLGQSGTVANVGLAIEYLDRSCEALNPVGCLRLGNIFAGGIMMQPDYVAAREKYEFACDLLVPAACQNLGHLYLNGRGVDANPSRAAAYYQTACQMRGDDQCLVAQSIVSELGNEREE